MESFLAGIEQMNGNIKASPGFAFKIPQGICWHLLSLLFIFLTGFQQQAGDANQALSHPFKLTEHTRIALNSMAILIRRWEV